MMRSRAGTCLAAMWLLAAAAPSHAPNVEPHTAFTEALARPSLALDDLAAGLLELRAAA